MVIEISAVLLSSAITLAAIFMVLIVAFFWRKADSLSKKLSEMNSTMESVLQDHLLLTTKARIVADVFPKYFKKVDSEGRTALYWAAINDMPCLFLSLLRLEACWDMVDKKGRSILEIIARNGSTDICDILLKEWPISALQGDKAGNRVLHRFAKMEYFQEKFSNELENVAYCLYAIAIADSGSALWARNHDELLAIELAIQAENVSVCDLLLVAQAHILSSMDDYDKESIFERPVLIATTMHCLSQLFELILKAGWSIEKVDSNGYTPLGFAAFIGCMKCTKELLKLGVKKDVEMILSDGVFTAADLAEKNGHADVCELLK